MATIVEVDLEAENFALDATFERCPGVEVEVEQVVAHNDERVLPFVWFSGGDDADIEAALEDDPSTANVERLTDADGQQFYQMEWVADIKFLVQVLVEEGGTVIDAAGWAGEWTLRILFPEHDAVSRTHDYCDDQGMTLTVKRIYELDEDAHGRYGLTEEQYETLVLAYEEGHFDVPRGSSLEALADDLGISHQALSERLRRGERELVQNTLVIGEDADTPTL